MTSDIQRRKEDHLDLCATDQVAFRERTTLLEHVRLVHQSLPELSMDDLRLETRLCGKSLRAPLVIAAMTGGTDRAGEINRELARIAEKRGYGFGLGSQRAMQRKPETAWTYAIREVAPRYRASHPNLRWLASLPTRAGLRDSLASLSGRRAQVSWSGSGAILSRMLGQIAASSALIASHGSAPGALSGRMASTGHSGSHTPQSMHSSGWMTSMFSPA